MDIMELGAIGELVGGVAVVASLPFVGLQVRGSNHLARAAAELEVGRLTMDFYRHLAEGDTSANWIKCYFTPQSASADEQARFISTNGMFTHIIQSMYRQRERGLLPDQSWKPLALALAGQLQKNPIFEEARESNAFFLSDDFRVAIDGLRATTGESDFWKVPESLRPEGA